MKIIISIRPERACKILNREKTIEVRKGLALYNVLKKAEERGEQVEFLMYVTKDKPLIRLESLLGGKIKYDVDLKRNRNAYSETLDGKVVAKFKAKAEKIIALTNERPIEYYAEGMDLGSVLYEFGLSKEELRNYLKDKDGTALHIKDLEIFDKPKELGEFVHPFPHCENHCDNNFVHSFCRDCCSHNRDPERLGVWCDRFDKWGKPLEKAPRSWCYAKEELK